MVKKIVKKSAKKKKTSPKKQVKTVKMKLKRKPEGKIIGKISHYFSNIDVAVINLISPLKIGETIRIIGGQETDFNQKVKSMQIEHEEVKKAKKGDMVGMKIDEKVHDGYKVYKI